jgi:hypothetical protein
MNDSEAKPNVCASLADLGDFFFGLLRFLVFLALLVLLIFVLLSLLRFLLLLLVAAAGAGTRVVAAAVVAAVAAVMAGIGFFIFNGQGCCFCCCCRWCCCCCCWLLIAQRQRRQANRHGQAVCPLLLGGLSPPGLDHTHTIHRSQHLVGFHVFRGCVGSNRFDVEPPHTPDSERQKLAALRHLMHVGDDSLQQLLGCCHRLR